MSDLGDALLGDAGRPLYGFGDSGRPLYGFGDVGLGDLLCTVNEVAAARDAVVQLAPFFRAAGSPPAYAPAVQAVLDAWNQGITLTDKILMGVAMVTPAACHAKDIGLQAVALMQQIGAATGKAPPPSSLTPGPSTALTSPGAFGLGGLLVGALAVGGAAWYLSRRQGTR